MVAGKRKSWDVELQVVDSNDGDTLTKPPHDNIACNPVDNIAETMDVADKSQQHHRQKTKRNIGKWTQEDMDHAIYDVEENDFSIRAAAKKWGIPPSSLRSWLLGMTTTKRKGPPTILSMEEELEVVEWCQDMAQFGCALEVIQLKSEVAYICQTRPNPFKKGLPGRSCWMGFCKCNPGLTIRTAGGHIAPITPHIDLGNPKKHFNK